MKKRIAMVSVLSGLLVGAASADVITFNSLTGSNRDPYYGHVEGTFLVEPTVGIWREAHRFGNPIPDIFGRSDTGIVETTENTTGLFTFDGVDLGDALDGGVAYEIDGFLGGLLVLSIDGTVDVGGFVTIPSPDRNQTLDLLRITMHRGLVTYNIDNINVTTVPEPATAALLFFGLAVLTRRRRDHHTVGFAPPTTANATTTRTAFLRMLGLKLDRHSFHRGTRLH